MEPTAPTPAPRPGSVPPGGSGKPWPAIILGVLAAVLAVVLVIVLASDDDDEDVATDDTTTTEQTTSTTEEETTTSTTEEETTTTTEPAGLPDAEAASVVWPDPAGDVRYDEPMAAVEGFAEELLAFVDPTYSEFMQGDNRSGEAEVRAQPEGPATTVAVRQMSDDAWYVLFAATSEVEITEPTAGSAVDHPLTVAGTGRGFEGQIRIAIFERGETEPLAEEFVTGGSGEQLEAFTGMLDWPVRGTGGWGVVVASTDGGPDGTTWAATAIPVGFIGGD